MTLWDYMSPLVQRQDGGVRLKYIPGYTHQYYPVWTAHHLRQGMQPVEQYPPQPSTIYHSHAAEQQCHRSPEIGTIYPREELWKYPMYLGGSRF